MAKVRLSATPAAAASRGSVVNWVGDSIAPAKITSTGYGVNSAGAGLQLSASDMLSWAHLMSNARILYGKAAGVTGERADQMATRIVVDALSSGGNWCGITAGTNDASAGRTTAQFAADIRAMCVSIVAARMTPILTTCVPNPSTGSPNQRLLMDKYRRFLIGYAADNGWPLVDWYSSLVDVTTGGYLTANDNGDGIHPSPTGKKIMGQVLADALSPYLPPFGPAVATIATAAQTANLIPNPLFLTDTNADGVPDSWTKSGGSVTYSIVTGDAGIKGNALRITDTGSGGFTQCNASANVSAASLIGHRVAFTGLVKNSGTSTAAVFSLGTTGAATNVAIRGMSNWGLVTGWQRFYLEAVIPAAAATVFVSLQSGGGTAVDAQIAQVGLYDLTDAGL